MHFDDRVELRFKGVPAFEEPALGRPDLRLIGDARLVKVLKRHPRLHRAEGVAVAGVNQCQAANMTSP
jgi:hypothetical protein